MDNMIGMHSNVVDCFFLYIDFGLFIVFVSSLKK